MKKIKALYREYFAISENGTVREKVMLSRITVSAILIVLCMASLCYSSYAYYSHSIVSANNRIEAKIFDPKITITAQDLQDVQDSEEGEEQQETVEIKKDGYQYTADLEANKEYTVTLSYTPEAVDETAQNAPTGFVAISFPHSPVTYQTQQLGTDFVAEITPKEKIEFTVKVDKESQITFVPHWGTSSNYDSYKDHKPIAEYITDGIKLEIKTESNESET